MRAPIHSEKHYVQTSLTSIAAGAVDTTVLIEAVQLQNKNTVSEVVEGALVKAIYIELWIIGGVSSATAIIALVKFPGGLGQYNATQLAALGTAPNKKNILFVAQGLTSNDGIAGPIPIMRGWYKIPRSKQRFGLGDTLELQVFAQAQAQEICGFATYKEYT